MTSAAVGISLGDPGGIGPEVVIKALTHPDLPGDTRYIVFGSDRIFQSELSRLGRDNLPAPIELIDLGTPVPGSGGVGQADEANGRASFLYFEAAVKEADSGRIDAVVTAPISKHSWTLAGIPWAGHTDYLSHLYPDAVMSFFSENLKLVLMSHHIPLKDALARVRSGELERFLLKIDRLLNPKDKRHRFLVAGLNPHAGEEGRLGREEIEEIIPAVKEARRKGIPVTGPFPPDTICREAWGKPDAVVVSLYHDQGLIAFKLACLDKGINLTLGLPFIRTSPDHGTAFDIAGKGRAAPDSMLAAIQTARRLLLRDTEQS